MKKSFKLAALFVAAAISVAVVSCNKDKIEVTLNMLKEMVDESSSIITLICGEDATSEEKEKLSEKINELYPDVDLEVRVGNQPVYSFIIGVE